MTTSVSRHGTVERDGSSGTIRFERILAHPVEDVWQALTTPDGLSDWWLPFPADITVDLVVGGRITFTAPEFGDAAMACEILELDAPYRLVHTHFDPTTTLVWELASVPDGCRLRLTQSTPDIDAALRGGHHVGLHHSLDRLEPSLDGSPVPWDWDRLPVIEAEYRALLLSPRQQVVERYVDGFRSGDHACILGCLTDDVTWDIVGHATAAGKAEFDALVDGPPGASLPRLTITRHLEQDGTVATLGTGQFDDADGVQHSFRFADTFTFRGDLICAVTSYVVAL